MLGLWEQGSMPMGMRLHVAFTVSLEEILAAPERLAAHGVEPRSFFGQPTGEPSVIGWMPAAAVYFRDPDDHQLEYLTMLEGPARTEFGVVPWSEWPGASKPPGPGPPSWLIRPDARTRTAGSRRAQRNCPLFAGV
jgi:lactoylglutathione lyase